MTAYRHALLLERLEYPQAVGHGEGIGVCGSLFELLMRGLLATPIGSRSSYFRCASFVLGEGAGQIKHEDVVPSSAIVAGIHTCAWMVDMVKLERVCASVQMDSRIRPIPNWASQRVVVMPMLVSLAFCEVV